MSSTSRSALAAVLVTLLSIVLMPTSVEAVKGVDLQGLASEENLACIRDGEDGKGGQFVVFRAWLGNNTFNPYTN